MSPDPLLVYLEEVESAIAKLQGVHVEHYCEEILTPDRANLRIRIRFQKGLLLEMSEAVALETGQISRLSYRYHFQDETNELIFRYDNTPHFPALPNFPHHKHTEKGVAGCERPAVDALLQEAMRYPKPMRKTKPGKASDPRV